MVCVCVRVLVMKLQPAVENDVPDTPIRFRLQLSEAVIEVADDPLEIEYELLSLARMDDKGESDKRAALLEEKIEELMRTVLLQEDKAQSMREKLIEKNAELFCEVPPPVTALRLFVISICGNSTHLPTTAVIDGGGA